MFWLRLGQPIKVGNNNRRKYRKLLLGYDLNIRLLVDRKFILTKESQNRLVFDVWYSL